MICVMFADWCNLLAAAIVDIVPEEAADQLKK
jgi:hypothetical protein